MTRGFSWRLEQFEGWFCASKCLLFSLLSSYFLRVFHFDKRLDFCSLILFYSHSHINVGTIKEVFLIPCVILRKAPFGSMFEEQLRVLGNYLPNDPSTFRASQNKKA